MALTKLKPYITLDYFKLYLPDKKLYVSTKYYVLVFRPKLKVNIDWVTIKSEYRPTCEHNRRRRRQPKTYLKIFISTLLDFFI